MAQPVSQLRWGPTFENVLAMAHPLYSPVGDRELRAGSEHSQGASGVEDAWVTGRDYTLECDARFLEHDQSGVGTPLTGPTGWQAFLDACRDKQPFRFVPDETVPDFYVDNCQLVEPMRGFGEMRDYRRAVHLKLRNPTVDFIQALRGLMFEYAPGGSLVDPVAATFSRATAATYRGVPGSLAAAVGASAASGVLRDRHYEGNLRTTLLEAARTQLVTDPENFGNWSIQGTVGRTSGQADPFGGTAAYLLDSNGPAASDAIFQTVAFTGNATKARLLFLRAGTSTQTGVFINDATAGLGRGLFHVNWSGGVPTIVLVGGNGTGTIYPAVAWGGGWYVIPTSHDGVIAVNSNDYYIYPDRTGGGGTVYAFGANAWNAPVPSSYQGPSLGTRNADAFTRPHTLKPQAAFFYLKFVERGTSLAVSGFPTGLQLSGDGGLWRQRTYGPGSATGWTIVQNAAGGTQNDTSIAGGNKPVIGDVVEILGLFKPDTSVEIHQVRNGGAVLTAAGGTVTPGYQSSFGPNARFEFPGSGADEFMACAHVKVGPLTFGGQSIDSILKARAA